MGITACVLDVPCGISSPQNDPLQQTTKKYQLKKEPILFSKLDFRHGCTCTELAEPVDAAARCRRQTFRSYLLREAISGKQAETKAVGMAGEMESSFMLQSTKSKERDCVLQ